MFEGAVVSNEKARAIFYLPQERCPYHAELAAPGKRLGANVDQRRRIRHHRARLPPPSSPPPLLLPLPQVMYYECCLITQPRIPHTGWHVYLFVLYLFASLLYAKPFCDRLVYFLAPPRSDQTNEQIEEGRRAIDGQSTGRCAAAAPPPPFTLIESGARKITRETLVCFLNPARCRRQPRLQG